VVYPTVASTYQWYRCDFQIGLVSTTMPIGCAPIEGATGATYTQVAADAGKYVTIATTKTNSAGSLTVWSISALPTNQPPTLAAEPAISGTSTLGSVLSVTPGNWDSYPTATNTYKWLACDATQTSPGASLPSGCAEFGGAVQVAVADNHACALITDGTVRCWGSNGSGQLGNGSSSNSSRPVTVSGLTDVVSIAAGYLNSCAVKSDGTLVCWGDNSYYQTGKSTSTANLYTYFTVPGITNAVQVSIGIGHVCVLLSNGTVKCWGSGASGQLGFGSTTSVTSTPMLVSGISSAVQVSAGGNTSCAVLSDGTVKCWGSNSSGMLGNGSTTNSSSPVTVTGVSNAVSVAVSAGSSVCATLSSGSIGSVKCWGYNNSGQLGNNSLTASSTPVAVSGVTSSVAVSGGASHFCTLLSDGSMSCWGYNAQGQLGNGTTSNAGTPVPAGLSGVVSIATGGDLTCASLANGLVKCWGQNFYGQLGNGVTTASSVANASPQATLIDASGLTTSKVWSRQLGKYVVVAVTASNSTATVTRYTASTALLTR
jgi:alpha-tubulin suppressor-like RCC1 family protein